MHANMAAISSSDKRAIAVRGVIDDETYTFSNGWQVSLEYITPKIAAVILLENNNKNRKHRRKTQVEKLRREMMDGQFVLLPDGLIFDVNGNLIQGQHRLDALIQSGVQGLLFIVWRNVSINVFEKLDATVPRSFIDRNETDRRLQEVVNQIARLYYGNNHSHTENKRILDVFADDINAFISAVGTAIRGGSTQAPVRAAVVLRAAEGSKHRAWLYAQYKALTLREYNDMAPVVQSLNRQIEDGLSGADLMIRAWRAFDYSRRDNVKIYVKDNSIDYAQMKSVIGIRVGD